MAELVRQRRGRRGNVERGEVATAVQGALPGRQVDPAHQLANWRGNHSGPAAKTPRERDQDLINKLHKSGRVQAKELCSFITPDGLLGQGENVDPLIVDIRDIINQMARTRRLLLDLKLKEKSKSAEMKEMEMKLKRWPVQIQQIQGQIEAVDGARYLMIPPVLVDDVELI